MREIKFRAWDIKEKKWMKDDISEYLNLETNVPIFLISGIADGGITIQQFTGLKDKNGKEIFEGDIVKYKKVIFCIEWSTEFASFILKYRTNFIDIYWRNTEFKIIGNIYENPELLEEKNAKKM